MIEDILRERYPGVKIMMAQGDTFFLEKDQKYATGWLARGGSLLFNRSIHNDMEHNRRGDTFVYDPPADQIPWMRARDITIPGQTIIDNPEGYWNQHWSNLLKKFKEEVT
jgi:hypothetical protein